MKRRLAIALLLFVSTLLTTQVVHAQTSSSGSYMYKHLNDLDLGWELGWYLFVIFMAGAFGGFVSFLMNFKVSEEELSRPIGQRLIRIEQELAKQNKSLSYEKRVELEKKAGREKWNAILKCCLSQSIVGGAAAPPVLLLFKPETAFALITMSLVVGTAGSAFFRALQEQMLEYIRREEKVTRQAQVQFKQQSDKVGDLVAALSEDSINVEKIKAIAEELKGACAVNTATFGKPLGDSLTIATTSTDLRQVNGSESMYESNDVEHSGSVNNQQASTVTQ